MTSPSPRLRRSLSLTAIVLYGLGTTIGAGIYVLIGEVAGAAGSRSWLAFALASLLAGLSAASFAELSRRLPRSAGEALYVREGLRSPRLATGVGLAVAFTGCVSAATITHGFVGYLGGFVQLPAALGIALFVSGLTGLAAWGVRESVWAAGTVTLLEIGGLLLVLAAAGGSLTELPARAAEFAPDLSAASWHGVFAAVGLTFYAFIGFEDMVNMAEEVRDVERTMPRAIAITLALTAALYVALAVVALLAVPAAELAGSDAPLVEVYTRGGGRWPELLRAIAVVAMGNGALIQIIMASRVLYGLSAQGSLPPAFGRVHPRRHTPVLATLIAGGVVAVLAWGFGLASLARATSLLTLCIFALVNLSLYRLKGREPAGDGVPRALPLVAFVASAAFVLLEALRQIL